MATKHYALSATKRDRAGKGAARALRREKQTPAVIYGDKKDPLTVTIDTKETNVQYNKGHMFTTLCDLDVDGKKHLVLARDVQLHPVTDNVLHVDFLRVTEKTKLKVYVPVHYINQETCPGLKAKGILSVVRHEVEIVCLAQAIPDAIEVDMSNFKIGDNIKISHASMPAGTSPAITDRDFALASISPPRIVLDDEPAEGEEGAEGAEASAEGAEGEKAEAKEEKSAE
ncbi:MAG TPA: 50S ribosomal protein L25/general stress protein Ctc [Alphaproteobacteria bacterium]|nr:50S ribosomal protein L25/general stress protein Ctc [Alphaproteobacteria bacterium]